MAAIERIHWSILSLYLQKEKRIMINYLTEPPWLKKSYHECPQKQREWLFNRGSFIERLKSHGIKHPEIVVLKQTWENPQPCERKALKIASRQFVLVREVLIKSIEGTWMVARAIFPKATLTGAERRFLHLKDHSLGSVLFRYPDLQRSDFEMVCIDKNAAWHQVIKKFVSIQDEKLWARRSIFTVRNKLILLSEVFLPDVFLLG